MPTLQDMKGRSAAEIFSYAVEEPVDMEIDQIPHREKYFYKYFACNFNDT